MTRAMSIVLRIVGCVGLLVALAGKSEAQDSAGEWLAASVQAYRQNGEWSGYVIVHTAKLGSWVNTRENANLRALGNSPMESSELTLCDLRIGVEGDWSAQFHHASFYDSGGKVQFRQTEKFRKEPGGAIIQEGGRNGKPHSAEQAMSGLETNMRDHFDVPVLSDVVAGEGLGRLRLNFPEAALVARETLDGDAHVLVDARGDEQTIRFWIGEKSKLISRMLVRNARSRKMREVVLTLAPHPVGSARGVAAPPIPVGSRSYSSFGLTPPAGVWRQVRDLPRPLGDSGPDQLADKGKQDAAAVSDAAGGAPAAADGEPLKAAVVAPPLPPPPAEAQALSADQMAGVVLIDGDHGAGSGFVARIKGVPFVVTNLHVAGGNANMRITTVGGQLVSTGAIYGAVGRDVAILRIEGDWSGPVLDLAEDPLRSTKLGDKIAVVGNRRGGGVATQFTGVMRGIGPDKLEVDAPFQPGNSGSPIVQLPGGEVVGVASYSQIRRFDAMDSPAMARRGGTSASTEQRWFGYRVDGVEKWEAINPEKWGVQSRRVAEFAADSEAIFHAMNGRFQEASSNPRVRAVIDRLEERYTRRGGSQMATGQEVHEFFRQLHALAETGVRELKDGDYHDFFRTSLYWETSIPEQLRARETLARQLDKASENASAFLAKLRR